MKNVIFSLFLMVLILSLAACGSAAEAGAGELSTGDTSLSVQLAIGTLLLEETAYAVTAAQAAELLLLWQAAQTLSDSSSAADVEIASIYNQIQETMNHEQIEQIESMAISFESMAALLEPLGISITPGAQNPEEMGASGGEFVPPEGAVMPGGEMPAEIQNLSEEEHQALREEGMGNGAGGEANPMLVVAVIQVLSEKVAQ